MPEAGVHNYGAAKHHTVLALGFLAFAISGLIVKAVAENTDPGPFIDMTK